MGDEHNDKIKLCERCYAYTTFQNAFMMSIDMANEQTKTITEYFKELPNDAELFKFGAEKMFNRFFSGEAVGQPPAEPLALQSQSTLLSQEANAVVGEESKANATATTPG